MALATADPRVVRPADLRKVYASPSQELTRLAAGGVLIRLAHGYYAVVPEEYRGTSWRPSVEGVGLGIGQADYGRDGAAVMGPSAARLHGLLPRALGVAVIAIPRQRASLATTAGRVRFVTRDVSRLDLERASTELADGWVTTCEQTLLDSADRPELGGLPPADVEDVIRRAGRRADWALVGQLAERQRKRPAAMRAAWVCAVEPPVTLKRRIPASGLSSAADPDLYGVDPEC